jgi:hypothetical protein
MDGIDAATRCRSRPRPVWQRHFNPTASIIVIRAGLHEEEAEFFEALAVAADELGGVGDIAFDGMPDIAVEGVFLDAILAIVNSTSRSGEVS